MQKLTSRQIQAQKTKRRIYNAAVDLFNKQGFSNTTIEEISKKAGVSVGAFYHYYPSKSEIYSELFSKIDEYYEKTVEAHLTKENTYDNLILFFKAYASYQSKRGTDAVRQLFNTENSKFLDESRYMFKLLSKLIKTGQEKNHLTNKISAEEIKETLMISARGIVYDWLLYSGEYDMELKMEKHISLLRSIFTE